MSPENKKEVSRFNPLRILLVCGVKGFTWLSISIIGCAVYGVFVGTVLPFVTMAKVAAIAFGIGFVMGVGEL